MIGPATGHVCCASYSKMSFILMILLQGIGKLISKASDLLRCINLNRFVSTRNESTLMHEAARLSIVNEFSAGEYYHCRSLHGSYLKVSAVTPRQGGAALSDINLLAHTITAQTSTSQHSSSVC